MNLQLSKISILAFLLLVITSSQVIAQKSTDEVLDEAFSAAQQEDKEVLVIFHASWCSWCKRMEKQLEDPEIRKSMHDTFEITYLTVKESKDKKDLENPGAQAFLEKHGGGKSGIPFWLIFDKDRNLLTSSLDDKGNNLGCPYSPEEVTAFTQKLKKYTSLSAKQLAKLEQVFVKK